MLKLLCLVDAGIEYRFLDLARGETHDDIRTYVTASITAEDLALLPNLEAVIVPFSAIDQLDQQALAARNIRIFHTSAHAPFVAERALVLTLCVLGKIVYFHSLLKQGDWAGRVEGNGFGKEWDSLFGKKIGFYGYGAIGQKTREVMTPFTSDFGTLAYKDRSYAGVELFDGLSDLARWCDVFVIAAPLNEVTQGSVDREILKRLKGKVLINIGRGPIIDEAALYDSLNENGLAGFGSDVWYEYPTPENPLCPPSNFPIHEFSHVVMTPHNGGSTPQADRMKFTDVAEQIVEISRGEYRRKIL